MNQLVNEFEEITRWPKKRSDKEYIIKYLSEKFESGVEYSEKEVNQIIKRHHSFNDFALLRKYFFLILEMMICHNGLCCC